MLTFPKETNVIKIINKNTIFNAFNDGLPTSDSEMITGVAIVNILDSTTQNVKNSTEYPLIYKILVGINKRCIPSQFLELLDMQMEFPVVYELAYSEEIDEQDFDTALNEGMLYCYVDSYMTVLPVKQLKNNHFDIIRIFYSGWGNLGFSIKSNSFETVEGFYKFIIETLTYEKFELHESIAVYVKKIKDKYHSERKAKRDCISIDDNYTYFVNWGCGNYESIKNAIRVILPKEINAIKVKAFPNLGDLKIDIDKYGQRDHWEEFSKNGITILHRDYSYVVVRKKMLLNDAISMCKQKYELINRLKKINIADKEQLIGATYDEVLHYEKAIAEDAAIFTELNLYSSSNEVIYQTLDDDLVQLILNGCTIKHYSWDSLEIYDFKEIKYR